MKCYHTYDNGEKFLIPMCMSVAHSWDIRDCTCVDPLSYSKFEKEKYNEELKRKNETIKHLLSENKRLLKQLGKLSIKEE